MVILVLPAGQLINNTTNERHSALQNDLVSEAKAQGIAWRRCSKFTLMERLMEASGLPFIRPTDGVPVNLGPWQEAAQGPAHQQPGSKGSSPDSGTTAADEPADTPLAATSPAVQEGELRAPEAQPGKVASLDDSGSAQGEPAEAPLAATNPELLQALTKVRLLSRRRSAAWPGTAGAGRLPADDTPCCLSSELDGWSKARPAASHADRVYLLTVHLPTLTGPEAWSCKCRQNWPRSCEALGSRPQAQKLTWWTGCSSTWPLKPTTMLR